MKEPVAGRHSLVRLYILDKPPRVRAAFSVLYLKKTSKSTAAVCRACRSKLNFSYLDIRLTSSRFNWENPTFNRHGKLYRQIFSLTTVAINFKISSENKEACRKSVSSSKNKVYVKKTALLPAVFQLVLQYPVDDSDGLNNHANCVDDVHATTSQFSD